MAERKSRKKPSRERVVEQAVDPDEPLSPEWAREIKRRVRDLEDPIRYIITSALSRRFVLYYNVSTDTFALNNPDVGTLFKRCEVAERVAEILGAGHTVVKFTTRNGILKRLSSCQPRFGSGRKKRDMGRQKV